MSPSLEKRHAWDTANAMLREEAPENLRYVVLELRRCIEAIVYEKLWAYRDRLPIDAATRWQPPQAFRALLIVEPDAEETFELRFAKEEKAGIPAIDGYHTPGKDIRFSKKWLTKTYNKLGGFLHATWPFEKSEKGTVDSEVEFLKKIAAELEPLVRNNFTSTIADIVVFKCEVCETTIKANLEGVRKEGQITCLNQDCGSRYFAEPTDTGFAFVLDASESTCPQCEEKIFLPAHKIEIGYKFNCTKCKCSYEVSGFEWSFEKIA